MLRFSIVRNDSNEIVGEIQANSERAAQKGLEHLQAQIPHIPLALIPYADQVSSPMKKPGLHINDVLAMPDAEREVFLKSIETMPIIEQAKLVTQLGGEALNLMSVDNLLEYRTLVQKQQKRWFLSKDVRKMLDEMLQMIDGQLAIRQIQSSNE